MFKNTEEIFTAYTRKSQLDELRIHPKLFVGDLVQDFHDSYVVTGIVKSPYSKNHIIRMQNINDNTRVYWSVDSEMFLVSHAALFGHSRAIYGVYFWIANI